jgi:hypothetical protein
VLFFVVSGLVKDARDDLEPVFASLACPKVVLVARLGLARKCRVQVRFGFCAFKFHIISSLVYVLL